ncbi:MAG: hypothetical protein KF729_05295 [Sandaracinaceae bacterium]|nr:hypothetical protein [Sandaracinaceae bacterium]
MLRAAIASRVVALASLAGCGAAPVLIEEPPALVAYNRTRAASVRIGAARCGGSEPARALHEAPIAPGASLRVPLPAGCYDLVAVDGSGEVVGEQRGVALDRPMTWAITR